MPDWQKIEEYDEFYWNSLLKVPEFSSLVLEDRYAVVEEVRRRLSCETDDENAAFLESWHVYILKKMRPRDSDNWLQSVIYAANVRKTLCCISKTLEENITGIKIQKRIY